MQDIDIEMAEAILDIPYSFAVDGKEYRIYPETLGKAIRMKTYIDELGITDVSDIAKASVLAYLSNPMAAARVVAISTLDRPEDIKSRSRVDERAQELLDAADGEDLAKLLAVCLQRGRQAERLMEGTGIIAEQERRSRVQAAKNHRNTYLFGGKTIYGQLIDVACERYGWTMDYVMWGISYTNLQMLLADQYTSLFLTDDEAKYCSEPSQGDDVIAADDPANAELIREMFKTN